MSLLILIDINISKRSLTELSSCENLFILIETGTQFLCRFNILTKMENIATFFYDGN